MLELILLFAVILAVLVCLNDPEEASSPSVPLRCADLASPDVQHLSYAGAHSHLLAKADYLGLPPMFYRQFSDWCRGARLFDPIFGVSVLGLDGAPIEPEVTSYEWRPDRATMSCKHGGLLEGDQILGYVGEETVAVCINLRNLTDEPVTVHFWGKLPDGLSDCQLLPFAERDGFWMKFSKEVPNAWGAPPSLLEREYAIATNLSNASREVRGNTYSATCRIPGRSAVTVNAALVAHPTGDKEVRQLIADPLPAFDKTTRVVDDWLASIRKPSLKDPSQLRMYYNAWYQFWHNTERPQGLWRRRIITPSKSAYGRGIWLWDTGFHVFALILGGEAGVQLAKDQIIVLAEGADVVGHLPREIWADVVSPELQAPGILTWAAMETYAKSPDKDFLAQIYPRLARNNDWFYANKDSNGNGLCEWKGNDSGWDTNPRWDYGEVEAVDLNCWLCLDQMRLAEMAGELDLQSDRDSWLAKAERTKSLIREHLWDETDGCYYDRLPATGEMVRVKTPATFWTMLAEVATREQAERMVRILEDPDILWTAYPMPSVGRNEPTFEPNNYWRGPTWINLNWITIQGLEKYGYSELAGRLREKSLEVIAMNPVPREYYNPETGEGLGALNYMWTGALYIVMCGGGPVNSNK